MSAVSLLRSLHRLLPLAAAALAALPAARADDSICARVKIEILQEVTLARQGFEARMKITNGLTAAALNDVQVTVKFMDAAGAPVPASSNPNDTNPSVLFFIRAQGAGAPASVGPASVADISWLIVPALAAGGTQPEGRVFFVGATLTYRIGSAPEVQRVDVTPDYITVKPLPNLRLDYFLTREISSDDPLTPDVIEPAEPFTLGVRVLNIGAGPARGLKIESSQPRIVENRQGLAIGFQIIGSEVNNRPGTNSLLVDFGDLPPSAGGAAAVARWTMVTNLSGRFVEFSAAVSHSDELGGQLTSLISPDNLRTHFLLHDVRVDLPGRDDTRDFLAWDADPAGNLVNLSVYESQGVDTPVADRTTVPEVALPAAGGDYGFTLPGAAGFSYVRFRDPFNGAKALASVVRSDGKVIRPENAWLGRKRNEDSHTTEYFFHLFDGANAAASTYRVTFGAAPAGNRAPVFAYIPDKFVRPGDSVGFLVQATDQDGDDVTLALANPPAGSQFILDSRQPGRTVYRFQWTPGFSQTGQFPVRFTAADGRGGAAETTALVSVTSNSLYDAWVTRHFGGETNPDIVGPNANPSKDGLPNLVKYALDLDPTRANRHLGPRIGVDRVGGRDYVTLTYEGRTDDSALVFQTVAADSAKTGPWSAASGSVPVDQAGVRDGFRRVKVRDSAPLDPTARPRRFLRLDVTRNNG